jgi:hypothetical protein
MYRFLQAVSNPQFFIEGLHGLRELELRHFKKEQMIIKLLEDNLDLVELNLAWSNLSEKILPAIAALQKLETLNVAFTPLTSNQILALALKLPCLRKVIMRVPRLPTSGDFQYQTRVADLLALKKIDVEIQDY